MTQANNHVIVAGFGPVGRVVTDQLVAMGLIVTVIDTNQATADQHINDTLDNPRFVFGDITLAVDQTKAGVTEADSLVLAIPDEEDALVACRIAKQLNPSVYVVVRTNFLSRGLLAMGEGADNVVVEEVVTAEAMRRAVVDAIGRPE